MENMKVNVMKRLELISCFHYWELGVKEKEKESCVMVGGEGVDMRLLEISYCLFSPLLHSTREYYFIGI